MPGLRREPFTEAQRLDAFAKKVDKRGSDECWEWLGGKSPRGYGKFGVGEGKTTNAHRVSWEYYFGPVPDGMSVLHECNNPSCVNPHHLYLGSQCDNMLDMVRAGHNQPPKLYEGEVWLIRRLLESRKFSQGFIGKMFRVSQNTISCIKRDPNYPFKTLNLQT